MPFLETSASVIPAFVPRLPPEINDAPPSISSRVPHIAARQVEVQDRSGPAPGLSFTTADWLHDTEIAGIATDTWGFEVRPNEFDVAFQPLHQVCIPNMGLFLGEMWDLDALAADCAEDGVFDFWLTAAPLPITGAVGSPVNPIAVK